MTKPTIRFLPNDLRNERSVWLQKHRNNVVTKYGEDGIIEKIFDVIGTKNKTLCDIGAADGKHHSNSYNLITNNGWRGILFEPARDRYKRLNKLYQSNRKVEIIHNYVGLDKESNLDYHLKQLKVPVPKNFDFLSIDIDGCDVHVWNDIQQHRPRVVCIEFNPLVPLDVYLLQARNLAVNNGNSLLATYLEAQKNGYELVATTKLNALFVDRPYFSEFNIPDNSPLAMHFLGDLETKIAMSYDGHLFLAGNSSHPWKRYEISEEQIQILPPEYQKFKNEAQVSLPLEKEAAQKPKKPGKAKHPVKFGLKSFKNFLQTMI
ncbi:hypothetical protein PsAD46_04472 [Pseudovibrio sp. Ad46]|uniref:FkbM family methyltransferase n=1 Tax=unclassified Pseudovibrio TaxID=2627060 RepID=UPI0007AE9095|nr:MULTISPECIES: FkbM family methyltransferase [unclassified Pseudovibrio]KZK78855.1 hypothetical protein PsAD46_04472 [Pseudovibrio sp. Ad46]KZK93669.1 hypothetical protein PsAD5_02986 [Pseudovibrio sp. Ad5]